MGAEPEAFGDADGGSDRASGVVRARPGLARASTRPPACDPGVEPDDVLRRTFVGDSEAARGVREHVRRVAARVAPVLLVGETGTGKAVLARALHELRRLRGPFILLNCGTVSEALAESRLFGHKRGAFTGATETHVGAIERATGGTLFLDEIAELPLAVQAKLLHALEGSPVSPLGDTREVRLSGCVVLATHADLRKRVAEGSFREDLYYRVAVHVVRVPALAERREDFAALVGALAVKEGRGLRFTDAAIAALASRSWRGNVRELDGCIERIAAWVEGEVVDEEDLVHGALTSDTCRGDDAGHARDIGQDPPAALSAARSFAAQVDAFKRGLIAGALRKTKGNQSAAARLLQMRRTDLIRLAKRYELL